MTDGAPRAALVVGAGLMGRWHAHEVARVGGRVDAVVDPDGARAASLAKVYDARSFTSLDDALAAGGCDVAHVCSPADSHVRDVGAALSAGLHVLAEKPLAPDAPATADLLDRAADAGLLVCPVHQFLFQPGVLRTLESLDSLGALVLLRLTACSAGAGPGADPDAVAADILPHGLALFDRLGGGDVDALPWRAERPAPGEVRAAAHRAGTSFDITVSMNARPTRNSLEILGGGGSVELDLFHGFAVREGGEVSRSGKVARPFTASARTFGAATANLLRRAARREPAYPGLRELIRRFHAAAGGTEPVPIAPAEALRVARARDTLLRQLGPVSDTPAPGR